MMNIKEIQVSSLAGQFLFEWWGNDFAPLRLEEAITFIKKCAKSMQVEDLAEIDVLNFLTDCGITEIVGTIIETLGTTRRRENIYLHYVLNQPDFNEEC